jgi:hypothetical protein
MKASGNPVPQLVVLSMAYEDEDGDVQTELLPPKQAADWWLSRLIDDDTCLIGHNIAFDTLVMARACADFLSDARLEEAFDGKSADSVFDRVLVICDNMMRLPDVERRRDRGTGHYGMPISDTMYRQKLLDNALKLGTYGSERGISEISYTLDNLEKRHLSRDRSDDKKGDDAWRLRYNELVDVPLEEWPEDARRYAREDAEGTLEVWMSQCGRETIEANGEKHIIVDGPVITNEMSSRLFDSRAILVGSRLRDRPDQSARFEGVFPRQAGRI